MKKFTGILTSKLESRGVKLKDFYDQSSLVERTILKEYGAVFVAGNQTILPPAAVFKNADEVDAFQKTLSISKKKIGGFELELQAPAMNDLLNAAAEAEENNLSINPRGADSARRNYEETIELWASRVNPALEFWTKNNSISAEEAQNIRLLTGFEQVPEIFRLEEKGIYFSKDLLKSIIYSVAPPGTSQHLSLLALDVAEYKDANVRRILAKHKWFQTVVSDLPHFTYLGFGEAELPDLGLKKAVNREQEFWIPNI